MLSRSKEVATNLPRIEVMGVVSIGLLIGMIVV
jgi:hypothetical protein